MEIISIHDFPLFIIPNLCCLCRFSNDLHDLPSWLRKPSTNQWFSLSKKISQVVKHYAKSPPI